MSNVPSGQLLREQGTEITYRPFNPLSLLAFAFGFISLLTIVGFAFLAIGVAGLVVGLIAMSGCEEGRSRSGYNFARMGVFLAAAGITMGLGHYFGRIAWLRGVARGHAAELIEAIKDDRLEEAYSLGLSYPLRPAPGSDLYAYYESKQVPKGQTSPPVVNLNQWMDLHPTGSICRDELRGEHEYVGYQDYSQTQLDEVIVLRYRYTPASTEMDPFLYDIVLLRRAVRPPIGTQWSAYMKGVVIYSPNAEPEMHVITSFSAEPRKRFKNKGKNAKTTSNNTSDSPAESAEPENAQEATNK